MIETLLVNGGKLNVQHHKFKKNLGLQSLILNLIGRVVNLLVSVLVQIPAHISKP
jgi:hypothetical protein